MWQEERQIRCWGCWGKGTLGCALIEGRRKEKQHTKEIGIRKQHTSEHEKSITCSWEVEKGESRLSERTWRKKTQRDKGFSANQSPARYSTSDQGTTARQPLPAGVVKSFEGRGTRRKEKGRR